MWATKTNQFFVCLLIYVTLNFANAERALLVIALNKFQFVGCFTILELFESLITFLFLYIN